MMMIMMMMIVVMQHISHVSHVLSPTVAVPTPDQALQQVVMLKKELAEIRANQALAEDKVLAAIATQEGHAPTTRSALTGGVNPEAEMERGAHRETMDTLEKSEQTVSTAVVGDGGGVRGGVGERGRGGCSVVNTAVVVWGDVL